MLMVDLGGRGTFLQVEKINPPPSFLCACTKRFPCCVCPSKLTLRSPWERARTFLCNALLEPLHHMHSENPEPTRIQAAPCMPTLSSSKELDTARNTKASFSPYLDKNRNQWDCFNVWESEFGSSGVYCNHRNSQSMPVKDEGTRPLQVPRGCTRVRKRQSIFCACAFRPETQPTPAPCCRDKTVTRYQRSALEKGQVWRASCTFSPKGCKSILNGQEP